MHGGIEMDKKLLKTKTLENGVKLDIYDISRKLAGDRWLVACVAKMEIPLDDIISNSPDFSDMDHEDIKKGLGNRFFYEQKRERNFIDEKDKEKVLNEICDSFVENQLKYLSHPDFSKRFIIKKYNEYKKEKKIAAMLEK